MQNRYYNPEWGRFINADGIIGETGELLGHNLFAYSKNNWANMSDYSGFRPVYTLGEETEAMRAASYAVMNRTRANGVLEQVEEQIVFILQFLILEQLFVEQPQVYLEIFPKQ